MKKEDRLFFSIFLKKSLQLQKLFTLILKKYLESIEGDYSYTDYFWHEFCI